MDCVLDIYTDGFKFSSGGKYIGIKSLFAISAWMRYKSHLAELLFLLSYCKKGNDSLV